MKKIPKIMIHNYWLVGPENKLFLWQVMNNSEEEEKLLLKSFFPSFFRVVFGKKNFENFGLLSGRLSTNYSFFAKNSFIRLDTT